MVDEAVLNIRRMMTPPMPTEVFKSTMIKIDSNGGGFKTTTERLP